jgi:hypothetical protein
LAATNWLRRQNLPVHAPLARYCILLLLSMAGVVTAASLVVPASWAGTMILAAAGLALAAVLIPSRPIVAILLAFGVVVVGIGTAEANEGLATLLDGGVLVGTAMMASGVALGATGLLMLRGGGPALERVVGVVDISVGMAVVGVGIGVVGRYTEFTLPLLLIGTTLAGAGTVILSDGRILLVIMHLQVGVWSMIIAASLLRDGGRLFAVLAAGIAVSSAAAGIVLWRTRRPSFYGLAVVGGGLAFAGAGGAATAAGLLLLGVAGLGAGTAAFCFGMLLLRQDLRRLTHWLLGKSPDKS